MSVRVKGDRICEIHTIPRNFLFREIGDPSPPPKKEIPFLGSDQMLWRPTSGVFRVSDVLNNAQDGSPKILDWSGIYFHEKKILALWADCRRT
jgi:hypothetical protein